MHIRVVLFTWALFLLLHLCVPSLASDPLLVRSSKEIQASEQPSVRLTEARLVYINRERLRKDFKQLRKLNDKQLDAWVLKNAAYLSKAQLRLNGIRQKAPLVDSTDIKSNFRTYGDQRVGYVEARLEGNLIGMINIKGLGNAEVNINSLSSMSNIRVGPTLQEQVSTLKLDPEASLKTGSHNNGLMSLSEAMEEMLRQEAIQRSFDVQNKEHGTRFETVETYFIIDTGVDILKQGRTERAALYGRQATTGRANLRGMRRTAKGAETLRSLYPIYVDHHGNVQISGTGSSVDFGAVEIIETSLAAGFKAFQTEKAVSEILAAKTPEAAQAIIESYRKQLLSPLDEKWNKTQSPQKEQPTTQQILSSRIHVDGIADVNVAYALGVRARSDESLRALLIQLATKRGPEQFAAIAALEFIKKDSSQEVLVNLAKNGNTAEKVAALEAMDPNHPSSLPVYLNASYDPNNQVKAATLLGLSHHLDNARARYRVLLLARQDSKALTHIFETPHAVSPEFFELIQRECSMMHSFVFGALAESPASESNLDHLLDYFYNQLLRHDLTQALEKYFDNPRALLATLEKTQSMDGGQYRAGLVWYFINHPEKGTALVEATKKADGAVKKELGSFLNIVREARKLVQSLDDLSFRAILLKKLFNNESTPEEVTAILFALGTKLDSKDVQNTLQNLLLKDNLRPPQLSDTKLENIIIYLFGKNPQHVPSNVAEFLIALPIADSPEFRFASLAILAAKKNPTMEDTRAILWYLHSNNYQHRSYTRLIAIQALKNSVHDPIAKSVLLGLAERAHTTEGQVARETLEKAMAESESLKEQLEPILGSKTPEPNRSWMHPVTWVSQFKNFCSYVFWKLLGY